MERSSQPTLVVSAETAGLGNRLKSWVSAMRLGTDVRVCWALNKHMPARFAELFDNDCAVDTVPPSATVYASWRFAVLPEDEAQLPAGFATVGAGAHPLVLAFVLGPMLENNLRKALILSRGDFWTFLERPISAGCLVIAALILLTPLLPFLSRKRAAIALDQG
jgi:hypothetical protein